VINIESQIAYLFVLIFFVVALNFYIFIFRNRRNNKRRITKAAIEEAKQALWRDKEIARRIEREQSDAYERVQLRNETLAIYEEVRKRAAARESEGIKFVNTEPEEITTDDIESFR